MDPIQKYNAARRSMWRWLVVLSLAVVSLCGLVLSGAVWALVGCAVCLVIAGVGGAMVFWHWWRSERYFDEAVKAKRLYWSD